MFRRPLLPHVVSWSAILVLLIQVNMDHKEIVHLKELVGEPSRAYYSSVGAKYSSHPTYGPDEHLIWSKPSLWAVADSQYEQLIHLRPLAYVPEETFIQMSDLDGYEMRLLASNGFWNGIRLLWLDQDFDDDGITNRLDACPDVPAPGDPLPLYLAPLKEQIAWSRAHDGAWPYDPEVVRQRHLREKDQGLPPGEDEEPPAEQRFNLYYGCPEESDYDHDGIATYRDACVDSKPTPGDPVIDHDVVRGPRSLFPTDQGCTKSQLLVQPGVTPP